MQQKPVGQPLSRCTLGPRIPLTESSPSPTTDPDRLRWHQLLDLLVAQADERERETEELLAVVGAPEGLEPDGALSILLNLPERKGRELLKQNNRPGVLQNLQSLSDEEKLKVLLRVLTSPDS